MNILGLTPLLVSVCCTDEIFQKCLAQGHLVSCWSPGSTALLHRYIPAVIMAHLGISMVYFDLDQLFLRNPDIVFNGAHDRGDVDTMWTHHLDGNCICAGMFYMRATPQTAEWLEKYTSWLYLHPYEIEQRGINAILLPNGTIEVSFKPTDLPELRLEILDDANTFVSTEPGWMGDFSQIVSMHFQYMPLDDKIMNMVPVLEELLAHASVHGAPPDDPSALPTTSATLSQFVLCSASARKDTPRVSPKPFVPRANHLVGLVIFSHCATARFVDLLFVCRPATKFQGLQRVLTSLSLPLGECKRDGQVQRQIRLERRPHRLCKNSWTVTRESWEKPARLGLRFQAVLGYLTWLSSSQQP
eukprot:s2019_g5.t2